MARSPEDINRAYFDEFWKHSVATYEAHPTSRHRRRFVVNSLARESLGPDAFVFDYGCGSGAALRDIRERYRLQDSNLGGCDIAPEAIQRARRQFPGGHFFDDLFPSLPDAISVAICSEVIEHTDAYERILKWLYDNLAPGGLLVLTTPGVPMDPPDESYGHVQHFVLEDLTALLAKIGYTIEYARRWGFPLFSLQKWITKRHFDRIKASVVETDMNSAKSAIFAAAYYAYFVHFAIPRGPQLFIRARRGS